MTDDEKLCPACAEIIKLNARVCKHCGTTFSPEELFEHIQAKERMYEDKLDHRLLRSLHIIDGLPYSGEMAPFREFVPRLKGKSVPLDSLKFRAKYDKIPVDDLIARAKFHEMVIEEPDAREAARQKELSDIVDRARTTASQKRPSDNQYGVLQPAANLAGGCLVSWQWLFLFFLIALIVAAIASIFE